MPKMRRNENSPHFLFHIILTADEKYGKINKKEKYKENKKMKEG